MRSYLLSPKSTAQSLALTEALQVVEIDYENERQYQLALKAYTIYE